MEIWIPIVIGIVCLAAGFAGGYVYRRNIAEAKIANAEEAVKKMIGDAQSHAGTVLTGGAYVEQAYLIGE